ncbi:F-box/kelch-repeat protein [Senna tora]|uniref:F-box/kelch-repeat protein n=1 Tax=Senna tora TaxID=362788 RepID=A0A834SMV5_9FABA|nr:F-box/kelch-repeat protein [Senna tora]
MGWNSPRPPLWSPPPPLPKLSSLLPSYDSITNLHDNRIISTGLRVMLEDCGFHITHDADQKASFNTNMELQGGGNHELPDDSMLKGEVEGGILILSLSFYVLCHGLLDALEGFLVVLLISWVKQLGDSFSEIVAEIAQLLKWRVDSVIEKVYKETKRRRMASKGMLEDLTVEILARLPVKSLMRFKSLSKFYSDLFTTPKFIIKHFQFSTEKRRLIFHHCESMWTTKPAMSLFSDELSQIPIDLGFPKAALESGVPFAEGSQPRTDLGPKFPDISRPSVNLGLPIPKVSQPPVVLELPLPDGHHFQVAPLGPCNGIFFLYGSYYKSPDLYVLWNPATKEVKDLPLPLNSPTRRDICAHGFGMDILTNDYKVVCIYLAIKQKDAYYDLDGNPIPVVEVYSLSTNSWREINVSYPCSDFHYTLHNSYLNGVYHWLTTSREAIVCLDLSSEVFYKMKLPQFIEDPTDGHLSDCNIAVLNDCIAYVKEYCGGFGHRIEIWVMSEHGVEQSWTKRFCIGPFTYLGKFCGFWKNNEILATGMDQDSVFSYDLHTQKPVLEIPIDCQSLISPPLEYVESMFPISVLAEQEVQTT